MQRVEKDAELMPEGSKWQIFVPSDLAYGASGAGKVIEPNSTLIFDLELMSIKSRVLMRKKRRARRHRILRPGSYSNRRPSRAPQMSGFRSQT